MGVDAGSIYSDVRVRLSALNGDILAITSAFDKLGTELDKKTTKSNAGLVRNFMTAFAAIRDVMMGPVAAVKEIVYGLQMVKAKMDEMENEWAASAEASAILANTLKTTGAEAWTTKQHLDEVAASLQGTTKFGDETITSMQGVLLGFRNITGKEFDRATEAVLDMATVMKMDLTSAAQTVGKALDNPALGLDSLSRQGFKFTKQEKEMMKAMQEAGDIAGAQAIILKELDRTYGGAAKAAGELDVSLRDKLKNAVGDVNEEIGRSLSATLAPFRERWLEIAKAVGAAAKAQNDFKEAIDKTAKGTATVNDLNVLEAESVKKISAATKELNSLSKYAIGGALKSTALYEKEKKAIQDKIVVLNAERNGLIEKRLSLEASEARRIQDAKDAESADKKQAEAAKAKAENVRRLAEYERGTAENARTAQAQLTEEAYRTLKANRDLAAIKFSNFREFLNGYSEDPEVLEQIRDINRAAQGVKDQALAAFINVKDLLGGYTEDPVAMALVDSINEKLKETEEKAKKAKKPLSEMWDDASGAVSAYSALVQNQGDLELAEMKKRGASEEELAKKKDEINRKSFEANKANSIASALISGYGAIMKTWEQTGILGGPVGSIIVGALTAAQVGMIAAQKYVPTMDTGGIVIPKGSGGVPTVQSVNGFPELNVNGGPEGRSFLREFARSIAAEMGGGRGGGQPIQLFVDGKLMASVVTRYQDNNQVGRRR